jgi:hypothetical protein
MAVNPINHCSVLMIQANKSSSPDEGVVEDEDVERGTKNGHAENNKLVQKKTYKCSKYAYVMLFLLY